MIRVAHIDTDRNLATVVLPATAAERALRIVARIARVAMSATDLQDITEGRLTLAEHITRGEQRDQTS